MNGSFSLNYRCDNILTFVFMNGLCRYTFNSCSNNVADDENSGSLFKRKIDQYFLCWNCHVVLGIYVPFYSHDITSSQPHILQMTDLLNESNISICQVPPSWPSAGVVSFEQVSLQYRPGLPNALNSVTFSTRAGEKVGIVGRTGSGKSSLFLTLFRMVQIQRGKISIDDLDIRLFHLQDLR